MNKGIKILPPTYFFVYLVGALVLHYFIPQLKVLPLPYTLFGLVPVSFGIMLNIWANSLFQLNNTTVKPYGIPTTMIHEGPYKFSRHPMYLGFVVVLLGVAILLGNVLALLAPLAMFFTIEKIFVPYEEKIMEEHFGEEYLEYKSRVRKWI